MGAFRAGLLGAAAVALLAACADDYGYDGYNGYSAGYVAGGPTGYYAYDGYYDNYYGPYNGGYWAGDGYFYYSDGGGRYHRDEGRHFSREAREGYRPFHGRPPEHWRRRDRDHDGDHDRDWDHR